MDEGFEDLMRKVNGMADVRELAAVDSGFAAAWSAAMQPAIGFIKERFEQLSWSDRQVSADADTFCVMRIHKESCSALVWG